MYFAIQKMMRHFPALRASENDVQTFLRPALAYSRDALWTHEVLFCKNAALKRRFFLSGSRAKTIAKG
ncbi:hypothetical protein B5F10_07450 [Anaerotruncus colihominis]|nr:hypothetical protein B5F10_07450 [Anaerotruncus colihominis]